MNDNELKKIEEEIKSKAMKLDYEFDIKKQKALDFFENWLAAGLLESIEKTINLISEKFNCKDLPYYSSLLFQEISKEMNNRLICMAINNVLDSELEKIKERPLSQQALSIFQQLLESKSSSSSFDLAIDGIYLVSTNIGIKTKLNEPQFLESDIRELTKIGWLYKLAHSDIYQLERKGEREFRKLKKEIEKGKKNE